MTPPDPIYGVWIRRLGWLKAGPKNECVCFARLDVAQDTARRFGGEARFFDDSLRDLEGMILEQEKLPPPSLWSRLFRQRLDKG